VGPRRNLVATLLTVLIIVVLALFLLNFISKRGKVPVSIIVAPGDASILLDEHSISRGTTYFSPGQYSIDVSREGFEPYSAPFEAEANSSEVVVTASLIPLSEEAFRIYATDPAFGEIEGIAGQRALAEAENLIVNNPIAEHLPHFGVLFNIGYGVNDSGEIYLDIATYDDEGKSQAFDLIKYWGFEPEDFVITFSSLQEKVFVEDD